MFLDGLAPLGVEYVEVVETPAELLPRLATAHTVVVGSGSIDAAPRTVALLEAFVRAGGGLVLTAEALGEPAEASWVTALADRTRADVLARGERASEHPGLALGAGRVAVHTAPLIDVTGVGGKEPTPHLRALVEWTGAVRANATDGDG